DWNPDPRPSATGNGLLLNPVDYSYPVLSDRRILLPGDKKRVQGRVSQRGRGVVMLSSDPRVWRERGLLSAVLAGDARAWQTWYDESFTDLAAYVAWRCAGLRDLADDVVQETWLTAVRQVARFDPAQASFAAWLRGIAGNVLRNH